MGRYSTPIGSLIARLKYHATPHQTPARRLAGFKIIETPTTETEGEKDLPNVRVVIPDFNEHFVAARNLDGKIEIKILIGSARAKGLVVLMQVIERVLDAIQTDENGYVSGLPGLARHFDCKVEGSTSGTTALTAPLTLFLTPVKHEVGKRLPLPPPPAPPTTNKIQGVGGEDIQGVGGEDIGGV